MAQDLDVDIMPGLHCWNFAGRRPLTVDVVDPFGNGPSDSANFTARFREFLSCENPWQDYPGLYKFLTEQYIIRCESRRVHFVPKTVPADNFACEQFVREKIYWAVQATNDQKQVANNVREGLLSTRRYEVALHSVDVKGFFMSGEELYAEIAYSIVIRPARPIPSRMDELKNVIYNPQEIRDLFACCVLHFAEPGSVRFFKDVVNGATYIDLAKDPVAEEERVFRLYKTQCLECPYKDGLSKIFVRL